MNNGQRITTKSVYDAECLPSWNLSGIMLQVKKSNYYEDHLGGTIAKIRSSTFCSRVCANVPLSSANAPRVKNGFPFCPLDKRGMNSRAPIPMGP